MTKRTRLFVLTAVAVLAVGLGTGLVASYMGVQGLPFVTGNGPDELAYVPADARLIGYADVRAVMDSELRQKFRELHPQAAPNGDFEAQTGINIETDVDHVVFAFLSDAAAQHPLAVARGRFDEARIETSILDRGGRVEDYQGGRLLIVGSEPQPAAATFVEQGVIVFGPAAAVRRAIETRNSGRSVRDNTELITLMQDVEDGTAWAVGRFDALAGAGRIPPGVASQLPPINLFAASGHINGGIRATLRAEAIDDAAAQNLRDVVRGFMALARLQAGQNDQLLALLNSVELVGDGRTVALSVTVPADALTLIAPRARRADARPTF